MHAMSLGDFGGGRPLLEGVDQDGISEVAVPQGGGLVWAFLGQGGLCRLMEVGCVWGQGKMSWRYGEECWLEFLEL